jgi:hypothetical protein
LTDYITVIGMSPSRKVVLAKPKSGIDLQKVIESNSGFGKDIFRSGWAHKGCFLSFRQKINPSLQISFFKDAGGEVTLQLDIDRFAPRWNRPIDIFRHATQEAGVHWVKRRILGRNPKTSQRAIAKAILKEQTHMSTVQ